MIYGYKHNFALYMKDTTMRMSRCGILEGPRSRKFGHFPTENHTFSENCPNKYYVVVRRSRQTDRQIDRQIQ